MWLNLAQSAKFRHKPIVVNLTRFSDTKEVKTGLRWIYNVSRLAAHQRFTFDTKLWTRLRFKVRNSVLHYSKPRSAPAMLEQSNEGSSKLGLKMNLSKTKVVTNIDDDRDHISVKFNIRCCAETLKFVMLSLKKSTAMCTYQVLGHKVKIGLVKPTCRNET